MNGCWDHRLTLRDPRVDHAWFIDLDGIVLQVEKDNTLPDAIFFFALLLHRFLEVAIKPKNLGRN